MIVHLSRSTLARKCWLDRACNELLAYRPPGETVSNEEREGLSRYLDDGISPADAAELFVAANWVLK